MNKKIIIIFLLFVLVGVLIINRYNLFGKNSNVIEQGHVVALFKGYEAGGNEAGGYGMGKIGIVPNSSYIEVDSEESLYRLNIPTEMNPHDRIFLDFKVKNTGDISEYYRFTVSKYWVKDGIRQFYDTSPFKIGYGDLSDFIVDYESSSDVRTIIYSKNVLEPEEISDILINYIEFNYDSEVVCNPEHIDNKLISNCRNEIPEFEDSNFVLEILVDSVQSGSCKMAMNSLWGSNDIYERICPE